jgi:hypothetical protein
LALSSGNLTYGGALTVTANGSALASGDNIPLVATSGGSFSGWFSSVSVPVLSGGLAWDTNDLATAGNLDVYAFTTTPLTAATLINTTATIPAAKLANHSSSAKAASVYPAGWTATASGATLGSVSFNGGGDLVYTAGGTAGTDNFTVTLYDGHGSQTLAVSVTLAGANTGPTITPSVDVNDYGTFTASGLPGTNYVIQLATTLSPANWTDYATNAAAGNGLISFTDTVTVTGHGGQVYYRLRQQ